MVVGGFLGAVAHPAVPRVASLPSWSETFESATTGSPPTYMYNIGGISVVGSGGNPGKYLSTGTERRWYFNEGSGGRFWATGDADFYWDVYLTSGYRAICNCAFWIQAAGTDPIGFWFRVQTLVNDGGFRATASGTNTDIAINFPAVPADTWMQVKIECRGTTAKATVTNLGTGTVINSPMTVDLASYMTTTRKPSGTMGQFHDQISGPEIRIDNIRLERK